MTTEAIVWLTDGPAELDAVLTEGLSAQGFDVVESTATSSPQIQAKIRVLPGRHFKDETDLRAAYGADRRLTLIIASDAAQEALALDLADARDEVVLGPVGAPVLAARLRRLLSRDEDATWLNRDMLTGLMNRRSFGRYVREALQESLPGEARALVIIDADYFKHINDEHGHQVGDQLLIAAANALTAGASPDDKIARLGGDEFGLLMARYDEHTLVSDAKNILRRFAGEVDLPGSGRKLSMGGSGGLALLRPQLTEPQLMQQAESALYDAKLMGRGRLMHFEFMTGTDADAQNGDTDLARFTEVTKHFSDRMARMVVDMGRRLVDGARRQALQDALTGAHNRRYFDERLAREILQAKSGLRPLSLMLIDIDNFHDVNVTYGWPSGDAVLRGFADVAGANIRLVDWLARYGGEEFCVVMPDTPMNMAAEVAERIRAAVAAAQFRSIDDRQVPVTVSIGLATLEPAMDDVVALVDVASKACLEAKSTGKNKVVHTERSLPGPLAAGRAKQA